MPATASFPVQSPKRAVVQDGARRNGDGGTKATAVKTKSRERQPKTRGRVAPQPARRSKPAREPRPSRKTRSIDPRPSLVRQNVGGQVWRFAQRPAGFDTRRADHRGTMTIEKALIALAALISAVLILAFGVDLITGWPFHRYSLPMDITYLISGIVLAYLTWHTYREQR